MFGTQALVPAYKESYQKWYPLIKKPVWNPPNWVFPAVWIPLKLLQSVMPLPSLLCMCSSCPAQASLLVVPVQTALWLVWKSGGSDRSTVALPLAVFGVHALLGNQWNGAENHSASVPPTGWHSVVV